MPTSTTPGPDHPPDPASEEESAIAVFGALTDPVRRAMLDLLARRGRATVTELAAALPISRQAVAKHLAQLQAAGLLRAVQPEGRRLHYRVNPSPIQAALGYLTMLANGWDDRLDALRDLVESPPSPD